MKYFNNSIWKKDNNNVNYANRQKAPSNLLKLDNAFEENILNHSYIDGKIVVIGASSTKQKDLVDVIKSLNLDKNKFEFCLDYNRAKSFKYSKLKNNSNYSLVLMGAVPHKCSGTGRSASLVEELKTKEGYPEIIPLKSNNKLKITKSNFKEALECKFNRNYILASI